MITKAYVEDWGRYGTRLTPYEKYNWSGRMKIETIDDITSVYIERCHTFFGLFTIFKSWIHESNIVFREENVKIMDCGK
jgi:hypothetical protein|tara:strand:+ start:1603 stop:1839 length:237 start_codon:yes stop_codon:yes gene_type:complete